jgi:hypothetical protein
MTLTRTLLLAAACAALSACGTIKLDRAISGGALGAGVGAFGGPAGALGGAVVGAGVGAFSSPSLINLGTPIWRRQGVVNVNTQQPYERPTLSFELFGSGRATYTNGCTVQYSAQNVRTAYSNQCSTTQINNADTEMYNYRLSQSGGGIGAPTNPAPVQTGGVVDMNRMRANCEAAADTRWGLLRGTARASGMRGDDRQGYEIDVAAGFQVGKCGVAPNGDVQRFS